MASHLTSAAVLVICLIFSASAAAEPSPTEKEIDAAVDDMQRAGYFSFAMLINMVQDKVQANVTFLMPTDHALSEASPPEDGVLEFLRRHSIPSPLLFGELRCLPSGTVIPTSQPGYMVSLSSSSGSKGRLCLNGIGLVSPDLCVAASSIRCHGINGVFARSTAECNMSAPRCPGEGSIAPEPSHLPNGSPASKGLYERSGSTVLIYGSLLTIITSVILLLS